VLPQLDLAGQNVLETADQLEHKFDLVGGFGANRPACRANRAVAAVA